jgi:hypothetical protein
MESPFADVRQDLSRMNEMCSEMWPTRMFDAQKETSSKWVLHHELVTRTNDMDDKQFNKLISDFITQSNIRKDKVKNLIQLYMGNHF